MLELLLTLSIVVQAATPPVVIYDLTHATRFDPADPAQVAAAWDEAHAVATLQGIVNRDAPRLYIRFVEAFGRNVDDYWMERMSGPGGWLERRRREPAGSLEELVRRFRRHVEGAVVYDPRVAATSNLASTIAGAEDLVAVRYDPRPGSVYSRLVASGPKLPVRQRLMNADGSPMFTGSGRIPGTELESTGSAKCDAHLWLKHHYLDAGKLDAGYAAFYIDQFWMTRPSAAPLNHHTLTNHDFGVARKAFFFDLDVWDDEIPADDPGQKPGTDAATLKTILRGLHDRGGRERMTHLTGFVPWAFKYSNHKGVGGKHSDVQSEWEFSRLFSAYNVFKDADAIAFGAMANASFYAHFPLKEHYPRPRPSRADLSARGLLAPDGRVRFEGRDFIIFYVGDFDAAAWVYQFMPAAWDHPDRGRIPLMWCISPVIERRAGMAMDYIWRTAGPNDHFAAADNGAGYLNPGMLQEPRPISGLPCGLDAWARHCTPLYRRWDLTITGFIIDGFCPGLDARGLDCYARFSPDGLVAQKVPPSLLHGRMPVLRADRDLGDDAEQAARIILQRVAARKLPFHWFRAILKAPDWYIRVLERVRAANPAIELLDAPTFFELYRAYLETTPEAAAGQVPLE